MDKLHKILIAIIIVLIILLGIMTYSYLDVRKIAKNNFNLYLNALEKAYQLEEHVDYQEE